MTQAAMKPNPQIHIEFADTLSEQDLSDLCDATEAAIAGGGGFGWVSPPAREVLERYWKGVLAVPERTLILARMDGAICGAVQLVEPTRHNEAQSFSATLLACFTAPWARGHGIGRRLMQTVEKLAIDSGYKVLNLDVRETQTAAISLCDQLDWKRWGTNPAYGIVGGRLIAGHHYIKILAPLPVQQDLKPVT